MKAITAAANRRQESDDSRMHKQTEYKNVENNTTTQMIKNQRHHTNVHNVHKTVRKKGFVFFD